MKRQTLLCVLLTGLSFIPLTLFCQDAEDFKRLTTDIEDLKATLQSCQQRLNEQRDEIRRLTDELARANSNNKDLATREDVKHLADKIKEVDEKRLSDNEKVREEFTHIGKLLTAPPKTTVPSLTASKPVEPKTASEKGYEYTVRDGDKNLSVIIQALGKNGIKVTQRQVIDANPNVNWNKLRIGQKIFIPVQQ
jgi:predicted nuclease with TOPRIM domain